MPVKINEVRSEVHAFDATALLTEEVMEMLTRRVAEELRRTNAQDQLRSRDTQMTQQRRQTE
jgi:hypothetical protein